MRKNTEMEELSAEIKTVTKWAISSLIDSGFLIIWVLAQWTTNRILVKIEISSLDRWILSTFQILFALSTLAPVAIYIYQDIRIMLLRAQRKVLREKQLGKTKGSKNG